MIAAVRGDRQRGGRNKFGTYYKHDRAQRRAQETHRTPVNNNGYGNGYNNSLIADQHVSSR